MTKRSWLLGAVGLALASWLLPKRRKKPMKNMIKWTNDALSRAARSGPMKAGMRKIKGLVR